MDENYYKQLYDLQAIDFVLVELNLYLDTHPNDPNALQQFNDHSKTRQQLAAQFEMNYGPLMQFGHSYSQNGWKWNSPPWPWQV
ncbi:MAG: spore coat protein CotJB [Bacilli bacterium]|jgi:spore coat protein JB|nr:spore coat protein CotJB [Bacilli bacterium]